MKKVRYDTNTIMYNNAKCNDMSQVHEVWIQLQVTALFYFDLYRVEDQFRLDDH